MDEGKFLLAARRYGKGTHSEYIISLDPDDFSQGSNAYVGKLRLAFLFDLQKLLGEVETFVSFLVKSVGLAFAFLTPYWVILVCLHVRYS